MIRIGAEELLLILFLALLLFGPGRLSAIARELGQSVREFRRGLTENSESAAQEARGSPLEPPGPPA
ncbi:Sec-independent protein translocase subunit TatA/TatB [Thermoflexus hugenholtzii]